MKQFLVLALAFIFYGCSDQKVIQKYPSGSTMEEFTINKENQKTVHSQRITNQEK